MHLSWRLFPIGFAAMAVIMSASSVPAESWQFIADANLTLNQSAYSDNWAGGETGNISWAFKSTWIAGKQLSQRWNNKNTLKLDFGHTHTQDSETKDWNKPEKTTDLIDLETLFNITMGWSVDPYLSARVKSQFLDASDPLKSRYLNPATFSQAVGANKQLLGGDNREASIRLGASTRQHLDLDVLDPDTGERKNDTTNDAGVELVGVLRLPFSEDKLTLASTLRLFQALYNSKSDELKGQENEDYWKAVDVDWESTLTASVTNYVMVSLTVHLLYDKEISTTGRVKEILALGLSYKYGG